MKTEKAKGERTQDRDKQSKSRKRVGDVVVKMRGQRREEGMETHLKSWQMGVSGEPKEEAKTLAPWHHQGRPPKASNDQGVALRWLLGSLP